MRVLLIEDYPDLIRSLARALRNKGYAVDEARDGQEGLFKAMSSDYDGIVLDIMLPKMDGWNVLLRLRREKKTPVLFVSARDTVGDRVRGPDSGADDYLVKPFDLVELLSRLRALIRRSLLFWYSLILLFVTGGFDTAIFFQKARNRKLSLHADLNSLAQLLSARARVFPGPGNPPAQGSSRPGFPRPGPKPPQAERGNAVGGVRLNWLQRLYHGQNRPRLAFQVRRSCNSAQVISTYRSYRCPLTQPPWHRR